MIDRFPTNLGAGSMRGPHLVLALVACACSQPSSPDFRCIECSTADECVGTAACKLGYCVEEGQDPRRCPARVGLDAGPPAASDAATSIPDAGLPLAADAATSIPDAGFAGRDAAAAGEDAALSGRDASSLPADAAAVAGADATPAYVQSNIFEPVTPQDGLDLAFAQDLKAGDALVASVCWSLSFDDVETVRDSLGNTFVRLVGPTANSTMSLSCAIYGASASVASGPDTVTVGLVTASGIQLAAMEVSGVSAQPFDAMCGNSGTGTSPTSNAASSSQPNELVFGGIYCDHRCDPGAGFTSGAFTEGNGIEYKIVSATGSYSADFTQYPSGGFVAQMVTLK
jgi:hypothetical protein